MRGVPRGREGVLFVPSHVLILPPPLPHWKHSLLASRRIDRKRLVAPLIGQATIFASPIQIHSFLSEWSGKWGPFSHSGPSPVEAFSQPVASVPLCPLTISLTIPLSEERSFLKARLCALKTGVDLNAASAVTDSSLSHTNTQEPMQVAWLTERRGEYTEAIREKLGGVMREGTDEEEEAVGGDRRWR